MNERYTRIRVYDQDKDKDVSIPNSLILRFFMHRSHREFAPGVLRALDAYTQAVGPRTLAWYPDMEGDWQRLDAETWERMRHDLLKYDSFFATLVDRPDGVRLFEFEYCGISIESPGLFDDPRRASVATFTFPEEFVVQRGPGQVRELALQMASHLPFHSGYASLSFNLTYQHVGVTRQLRNFCFRYPGMDVLEDTVSWDIGTRVPGAYWLTFLANPVLGELGGVEALRARLSSSDTTVQQLEGDRAVVTLGQWPEAGDLEAGDNLPAHRELARVLEPWLYHSNPDGVFDSDFPPQDKLRWERRFLD